MFAQTNGPTTKFAHRAQPTGATDSTHIERVAQVSSATASHALAMIFAAVPAHRRNTSRGCSLPGAEEGYSLQSLRDQLDLYQEIDADRLRHHQIDFLSEIIPVAEQLGIRM
ncbi:hypothetical protein So717_22570 [Roseobacter cerasinus]|uniref:Uncharacterized protein n=1 Tax=Roseobacter cerasinus TaxID=2602289 RepID=A0A640VSB8_9RHOB|nr:hypothetical protein So717_22570 [Roseobacter cerasinus]